MLPATKGKGSSDRPPDNPLFMTNTNPTYIYIKILNIYLSLLLALYFNSFHVSTWDKQYVITLSVKVNFFFHYLLYFSRAEMKITLCTSSLPCLNKVLLLLNAAWCVLTPEIHMTLPLWKRHAFCSVTS